MPKASFASRDAYEPKLGFQEGNFEVVSACTKVFQYPPNKESGEQFPPFLCAMLMMAKTDEQGNRLDDEPQEKILRIEKDLEKMRPGRADSRDDAEPEDLGAELDTEGNTVFCEEGQKINVNSAFIVFTKSLEEKGFKSEILGAGFLPDLVGTKGHGKTEKGTKRSIGGRDVEPAYFIVDRLLVRPYEKSASGKKPMGKAGARETAAAAVATPAKAGKPNGSAGAAAPPVTAASDDADAVATALLVELSSELAGETREAKKLFAMAYSRLVKDKARDKKLDKPVSDLLKDEDWLAVKAAELELYQIEDGVFTFAAAA